MTWELIEYNTLRAKIFGGWLVKVFEGVSVMRNEELHADYEWRVALTFVPDPKHEWEIIK